jgi:hypothetical protein
MKTRDSESLACRNQEGYTKVKKNNEPALHLQILVNQLDHLQMENSPDHYENSSVRIYQVLNLVTSLTFGIVSESNHRTRHFAHELN